MYRSSFFAIIITALILLSCKSSSKEAKVLDFLNKNEKRFDKKTYELIKLNLIDTIHEDEVYRFYDKDEDTDSFTVIDSTDGPDPNATKSIDWKEQTYALGLFRYINAGMSGGGDILGYNHISNVFLGNIVKLDFKDFQNKLLFDQMFKKQLIEEMAGYEYFTGVYHADSVENNVNTQLEKRKKIYGYEYDLKYRVKTVLHHKRILFDNNGNEIISQFDLITQE